MNGLPEVTIAGALTSDPEIKYLDSGACVANFTVAANDRRFDREKSAWVDGSATFLRCSVWNQMGEHVAESLFKGTRVLVSGVLKQRKWETDAGEKRSALELAVSEVGASLKFATTAVKKAERSTENTAPSTSPTDDEPPF